MSSTSAPFTHKAGEALQESNACWVCNASEKGVHLQLVGAKVEPVSPISEPDFGSLVHDPVLTVSPSKMEQTSEVRLVLAQSAGSGWVLVIATSFSGRRELSNFFGVC